MDIGTSNWVYDPDFESILIKTSMVDGKFDERYEMKFFSQQYNVNPNNLVEATTNAFDITTNLLAVLALSYYLLTMLP